MTKKQYGLIGYPLGHSFSKKYFTEKFEKENLTGCSYENFEIQEAEELPEVVGDHPGLIGLNVTIPHKQAVMKLLDELDPKAEAIGAVNTIKISRNADVPQLKGFNTDVIGFAESLKSMIGPHHIQAFILGTGGSSKAVAYALGELGIQFDYVSRSAEKADYTYRDLTADLLKTHLLIINTTPLGMHPNTGEAPDLPYEWLSEEHLLYDLIYNPAETTFMKMGRKRGATTKNGLDMLIGQAEAAWKIWNDL